MTHDKTQLKRSYTVIAINDSGISTSWVVRALYRVNNSVYARYGDAASSMLIRVLDDEGQLVKEYKPRRAVGVAL